MSDDILIYDQPIWQEMISGEPYHALDPMLIEELNRVKDVLFVYNNKVKPSDLNTLSGIIKQLFGRTGSNVKVLPPFRCDYGHNIEVGENFFSNFNFTVLDEGLVQIGDNAFIAPNVSIYTACHPIDPDERNRGVEWSKAVRIGDNVWIGGSVTILPGVSIGDNVTIGAGSVVVKDLPDNCVAVGNPAKVVKKL